MQKPTPLASPYPTSNIPNCLVEYTLQVSLCQSRTFQIFVCADFLCNNQGLVIRYRLHTLLSQALKRSGILSQIKFCADEDNRYWRSVMVDFGEPLKKGNVRIRSWEIKEDAYFCSDVVEGWWRYDRETDKEDISLRIRQWTQSVVIFLSSSIP